MSPAEIHTALSELKKEDIVGIECKHATYTRSQFNPASDLLTVKELIHTKDGRKLPRLRMIKDYKRPFWITKKAFRTNSQKKEWEYVNKCELFETTQCNLNASIVRALGYGNPTQQLRILARSQYLYGCDISTPALIKHQYQQRSPGLFTPNTVAVLDTETDMLSGEGKDPILVTVTFKEKVFIAVREDFVRGIANPGDAIIRAIKKYLAKYVESRNLQIEVFVSSSMGEMCYQAIQRLHQWQPDFVTFWNMDFDMNEVIIPVLKREGYDLADVFSDPRVPNEYKYFHYREGPKDQMKADGNIMRLASYDRWHVVTAPCSFQFIDSMCVYRQIRKAKGKAPSYSLSYTLQTQLNLDKLYFDTGDSTAVDGSADWHRQMQREFKIPYVVYNVFDCIGVELLDEKTRDLQTQISILSGFSEYSIFHSNPRRAADQLHFFCLNIGKVAGCVSDQMVNENDKLVIDMSDWIVTLPTHLVENNGLKLIKELPDTHSLVRMYVSDADITSTYPNGEIIMNLSKETTMLELARIRGIPASRQRIIGINLTGGPVNAIEIMTEVMKAPTPQEMLADFKQELANRGQPVIGEV